ATGTLFAWKPPDAAAGATNFVILDTKTSENKQQRMVNWTMRWEDISALGAKQHGIATRSQLAGLGYDRQRIKRRRRPGFS
ncbi:MAG TPA: hypothetical protein VKY26_08320, partial [Actinomycetota bacterium]|nr:hypothetical protein [Actinomycetota bacterium]